MLPSPAGVVAASALLQPHIVRTPLLECRLFNEKFLGGHGRRLLLKAECLQVTGSFKYRGALHRLLRLRADDPDSVGRGVVAFSSGNFGQALAAASTSLGIRCAIVSPHDAPMLKLDRIRGYGADLRVSNAGPGVNREVAASEMARDISEGEGMTLLHPFEDVHVVHGQGSAGVELLEQAREALRDPGGTEEDPPHIPLDTIVVPCGGGGLTAGINLAVEAASLSRSVGVVTVEPSGYDDHAHSFRSPGKGRLTLAEVYPLGSPPPGGGRSQECDALMAGAPGLITWAVNGPRLKGALASAGDSSVARAMRVAFDHFRVVLEPSGALALAALLDGDVAVERGKAVCVVASGGNIDMATFARLMGCSQKDG